MKRNKVTTSILTIFVIAVLVLSAPAQAIQLNLSDLPSSGAVNSSVAFKLQTEIDPGENIPIDDVTLTIDGPGGLQTCRFEADGSPISGCEGLDISLIEDTTNQVNSPDRYGDGFNGSDDVNTSFGYGYGFGNGPITPTVLVWQVQWNTTGKAVGDYDVDFFLSSTGGSESRKYRLETPDTITLGGTTSVTIDIKPPFPIGNNYVLLCNAGNFSATSYDWNFGDGSKIYDKTTNDIYHTFAPGTYQVTCVANDGSSDAVGTRVIVVGGGSGNVTASADLFVKSGFPINNSYVLVCNTTVANAQFNWVFGDGQKLLNVSNGNVFHTYATGQYNASCTASNGSATASDSLQINASFVPPVPVTTDLFIKSGFPINGSYVLVCNSSVANAKFDYQFGDGQKLLNVSNTNVFHTYAAGTYNASCTAKNGTTTQSDSLTINATFNAPAAVSASLLVAPWWPQGNNYVLVCNTTGFVPTSYDWKFGDGQKSLNIANKNVFHAYGTGIYNASCTGKNGNVTATGNLQIVTAAP